MWFERLAVVLIAAGVVGGVRKHAALTALSPPVRADSSCVDCVALDVDLHAHTRYSDGFLSPMELVFTAQRKGLHAVAVTEHNVIFPAQIAADFSRMIDGPTVLVGQEVTSKGYHLIAVGLSERIAPRHDLGAVIDEVHRQGGVAIAAHPTARYWPAFDAVRERLDGAEVVHPAAYTNSASFSHDEMVTFFERPGAKRLTAIGASDFHFFDTLALCTTEVVVRENTAAAIIGALREGSTRTVAPDGRVFGRPRGATSPTKTGAARSDAAASTLADRRAYAPLDSTDAVLRILGYLGVLLLFAARTVRPTQRSGFESTTA